MREAFSGQGQSMSHLWPWSRTGLNLIRGDGGNHSENAETGLTEVC